MRLHRPDCCRERFDWKSPRASCSTAPTRSHSASTTYVRFRSSYALDDFGTGFSSLSYLHRYRLDALKIDQSFISRIGGVHNDAPIVSSIVNLARQLGMGVIAEGVETPQQAKHLKALDCPHAQGYLFSRPLTATEARAYWPAYPPPARRTTSNSRRTPSAPKCRRRCPAASCSGLGPRAFPALPEFSRRCS